MEFQCHLHTNPFIINCILQHSEKDPTRASSFWKVPAIKKSITIGWFGQQRSFVPQLGFNFVFTYLLASTFPNFPKKIVNISRNFVDSFTCDPTVCVVVLPHGHELHGGQPPQLQRRGVPELAQVVGGQGQLHAAAAGHTLKCQHRTRRRKL